MPFNKNCFYCTKSEPLNTLMMEVCKLEASTLYLMRDQTHMGRCVVALNDHKREIFELEDIERQKYFQDISKVAAAINKLFSPKKINYASYGDVVDHLHFHIVPKYMDGAEWGEPFKVGRDDKTILSDAEYKDRIEKIKTELVK